MSINSPLISVIIPIYKVEAYLRECVDSIINQTYKNLEIILVDDGSPDNCGKICDEYAIQDNRIVVIHKLNGGLSDARNAGLEVVHGDYVCFVDSDDFLPKICFETIIKESPFDIALTGIAITDEEGAVIKENKLTSCKDAKSRSDIMEKSFRESLFGYAWGKMYRASLLKKISFKNIVLREDFIFNLEVFNTASVVISVDVIGYFYRQRFNSLLHDSYRGNLPDYSYFLNRCMVDFGEKNGIKNNKIGNYIIKVFLIDYIKKYVLSNSLLSRDKKKDAVYEIFHFEGLKKYLKIFCNEPRFFAFLTVCVKTKAFNLLFKAMEVMIGE